MAVFSAIVYFIFAALPAQIDDLVFELVDASDNNCVLLLLAQAERDVGRSLRLVSPKATARGHFNPLQSFGKLRTLTICANDRFDLLSQPTPTPRRSSSGREP